MPKRITNYDDAGEKMQMVIDYCALNEVVPRKSSDPVLPDPWQGVTTEDIQKGIEQDSEVTIGKGTATYTWQRLGADNDRSAALEFLEERRELFKQADLNDIAGWKS